MNAQGFIIARNKRVEEFFTSRSSYDKPSWIGLNEATVYHTGDVAQLALKKLLKGGAYEARLITVAEAIELSTPDEPQDQMVAKQQTADAASSLPSTVDHQSETNPSIVGDENDDDDEDEVNQLVDQELEGDQVSDVPTDDPTQLDPVATTTDPLDAEEDPDDEYDVPTVDVDGAPIRVPLRSTVGESAQQIKYKDPSTIATTNDNNPGDHEQKVKVPANVMADIQAVIDEYAKEATAKNARDDTRASHCLTVATAMETLRDILKGGTVLDVKKAQIEVGTWMNPISVHLPLSAQKFIAMGGRKPTLSDMFTSKREDQKLAESMNHMGERVQYTYAGWKAACRRAYPNCTFRGDKDIGGAVVDGKDVGEWDGAEGSVFKKTEKTQ